MIFWVEDADRGLNPWFLYRVHGKPDHQTRDDFDGSVWVLRDGAFIFVVLKGDQNAGHHVRGRAGPSNYHSCRVKSLFDICLGVV